jgi:hypothetical protein
MAAGKIAGHDATVKNRLAAFNADKELLRQAGVPAGASTAPVVATGPATPPEAQRERAAAELTAVEHAMIIFTRDPTRSLTDIADEAGCDRSLFYKDERLIRLREAHQGKVPRGSKSKEGEIEAEQDE